MTYHNVLSESGSLFPEVAFIFNITIELAVKSIRGVVILLVFPINERIFRDMSRIIFRTTRIIFPQNCRDTIPSYVRTTLYLLPYCLHSSSSLEFLASWYEDTRQHVPNIIFPTRYIHCWNWYDSSFLKCVPTRGRTSYQTDISPTASNCIPFWPISTNFIVKSVFFSLNRPLCQWE